MFKQLFIFASLSVVFPVVGQEVAGDVPAVPLMPDTTLLQEVVVKASPVISKINGNSYLPSAEKVRTATSGLDLLQKMQLPRISVNQLTGAVNLSGGGNVKLCVNGVDVSSSELASIPPSDIIRIVYYDKPGVMHPGADAVIDYITRRHQSGGDVMLESFDAIGNGKWASIDNVAARYNHGKSALSLNAEYMGLHRDNWLRDYSETWHYPDASVSRVEVGQPVTIGGSNLASHLNYSLAEDRVYFFNLRASFDYDYTPNKEEGDRHTLLHTSGSDVVTEIREHTSERQLIPSLNLYYRRYIRPSQSLIFNGVATYVRSKNLHSYSESTPDVATADILSIVRGRKYSGYAEGMYDATFGPSHLTAGVRHTQSFTANDYTGSVVASTGIREAQSSLFGEYSAAFGPWGVMANLTATRIALSQGAVRLRKYALLPSVALSFRPAESINMRYNIDFLRRQPSLAYLSDVEQMVQPGMVRRGNPYLKSFSEIDQQLTLSWMHSFISADVLVSYRYEHRPVMSEVMYDGTQFVATYYNQRSFRELRAELSLAIHPWGEHLSLYVSPSINRYFSYGNSYTHIRNIVRVALGLDFSYGNFTFNANTMSGAANTMYGEEIITEKDMNMILAGYKRPGWYVQAGVFNAFMKNYWMKTENMSVLTPFTSNAHCGRNCYFAFKAGFTLQFGHSRRPAIDEEELQLRSTDNDAGIIDGLK